VFDSGANDYIVIPFSEDVFIARLKALGRRIYWDIKSKEQRSRDLEKQRTDHQVCQH
jgi:DNA-binding response OmpR family regulator